MDTSHLVSSLSGPAMDKSLYAARLAEFARRLKPNSIAVVISNPERTRSNDTEFEYRQSSDLLYLTGFPEPESALIVSNVGGKLTSHLFVLPKDRKREVWTGIRHGIEGARKNFICDKASTSDQFAGAIVSALASAETIYYKFGANAHFDALFESAWKANQKPLENVEEILHEMRLFKSPRELEIMRHAAKISAAAHVEAMRLCAPGSAEYQVEAILESVFRFNGADGTAYNSIVAGGNNAVILHYTTNRDRLKDGDLLLIDAACEYRGYASDITRTFPVSGKFSEPQRILYQLVLDSQLAAIRASKPGNRLDDVHNAACRVLRQGLAKLGLISQDVATLAGERRALKRYAAAHKLAIKSGQALPDEPTTLRSFYMHGTSHWIGLDVHDVGTGGTRDPRGKKRELKPGMCFTVEPGLYFDKNDKRVPKKFRGIGIRIEDDIAITEKGHDVLTAGVPKAMDIIERIMDHGNVIRMNAKR